MFRRLRNRLPADPSFPTTFEQLGYFINDEDQIRQTAHPSRKYQYKINRSERVNDVYKEAMNTCTGREVMQRLLDLGLTKLRLPLGASETDKHVPILVSPGLATKKHIIVLFPDRHNELGILAYRVIGDDGINAGSLVNFVREVLKAPTSTVDSSEAEASAALNRQSDQQRPGLIIANTSQLIWFRSQGRAVTDREWQQLPRESALHGAMRIDQVKNRVAGQKDFREHIQYIFEHLLSAPADGIEQPVCNQAAKISIIGLEYCGSEALHYLAKNWMGWRHRLNCVALINPQHKLSDLFQTYDDNSAGDTAEREEVTDFIVRRTRAYKLHISKPLEALVSGRPRFGCNVYSAGESYYEENCFVRCWPSVLDWIEMCHFSDTFAEPTFDIVESDQEEKEGAKEGTRSPNAKGRSPRKVQTDEQATTMRFHGDLEFEDEDFVDAGK